MTKKILLSGIKPTNRLTLGNYLGALKNWVSLQSQYDCLFLGVDLHSITVRQDPKELRENSYFALATYIAAGIDPKQCLIFLQSHVPEHAELAWVLNCYSYMGELNRMTQFKDKSSKAGKNIPVGLFTYPVLMAADILLYQAHLVPVGEDQKQHIELTRDLAIRMNNLYDDDLFRVPEVYIPPVGARIMDLQNPDSKMGKSDSDAAGAVYLNDTDDQILKKFKRAVTDSGSEITYSEDQPGVRNLLTILASCTGKKPEKLVEEFVGKQYGHLKIATGEAVIEKLRPIREKTTELLADRGELDRLIRSNAERARERAQKTIRTLYDRIGFA